MNLPPLPEPDGSAEAEKERHPDGGYTYTEIDAWSESLVRAYAEAAVLAERATQADALHVAYSQGVADGRDAERERCAALMVHLSLDGMSASELAAAIRAGAAPNGEN